MKRIVDKEGERVETTQRGQNDDNPVKKKT